VEASEERVRALETMAKVQWAMLTPRSGSTSCTRHWPTGPRERRLPPMSQASRGQSTCCTVLTRWLRKVRVEPAEAIAARGKAADLAVQRGGSTTAR